MTKKYAAFDTETGGLEPKQNPILTFYMAIIDEDFSKIDEIDLKIRPSIPYDKVDPESLAVNKIDIRAHIENPSTLDLPVAREKIREFLKKHKGKTRGDKPIPLGHNLPFDLRMIFEQIMPQSEWEQYMSYAIRDTKITGDLLKDAGLLPPEIGNLKSLIEHFNIKYEGAHTAKGDVLMTVEVFRKMLEMLKSLGNSSRNSGLSLDVLDILEK